MNEFEFVGGGGMSEGGGSGVRRRGEKEFQRVDFIRRKEARNKERTRRRNLKI